MRGQNVATSLQALCQFFRLKFCPKKEYTGENDKEIKKQKEIK